jgi:tryptophan-rich hypothetical protein
VQCTECSGTGRLPIGGYHARNPVTAARVVGSKWTAMERTLGWRHYRATQKRQQGEGGWFVELVATCDDTVKLWVNIKTLKDRSAWAAGWLQRRELEALESSARGSKECKACGGGGKIPCPVCSRAGEVIEL